MKLFIASSLFVLASCSTLKDIDKPVCVELNLSKGYCTTIISGKDFIIDDEHPYEGKTWFESRVEMVQVPIDTWAAMKKYLIMNCKRSKKCNENIDSWTRSMITIDEQLVRKVADPVLKTAAPEAVGILSPNSDSENALPERADRMEPNSGYPVFPSREH
jgi:hypothetical protein